MVGVIIWALVGLVAGGILDGELADLGASHRGDIGRLGADIIDGNFGTDTAD